MHGDPHLRIIRVFEDADEDGELVVPEPEGLDVGEVVIPEPDDNTLRDLRYEDQRPWRCGPCNQPVLPGWARCPVCGQFREDCEA